MSKLKLPYRSLTSDLLPSGWIFHVLSGSNKRSIQSYNKGKRKTLMLIKVRLTRINSFKSSSGKIGRQIDFTEEQGVQQPIFASTDADQSQMVGEFSAMMGPLMKGLQGMFPTAIPRMSIWLLEEEVDELGIPLEVNRVYNMEIVGGRINLQPAE
jgi:hypothetical protein